MKLKAKIQHGLALKRAKRKHDPILIKLLKQSLEFLEKNKDINKLNEYLEDSILDWRRYCDKFNPENRYSPSPDAYIDNLVSNVKKK